LNHLSTSSSWPRAPLGPALLPFLTLDLGLPPPQNDYYRIDEPSGVSAIPSHGNNADSEYDPYAVDDYPATRDGYVAQKEERQKKPEPATGDEESKWIHRDKLAQIESQELRAAGIILPKQRAMSRPRRERSQDKMNAPSQRRATDASEQEYLSQSRSRKNSNQSERPAEVESPSWDLRLPQEIAEDPDETYWVPGGSIKGSRIPLAKASPAPVPVDYLERDAPMSRKASGSVLDEDFSISMPRTRSRSNSSAQALQDSDRGASGKQPAADGSPRKGAANGSGARKNSAVSKPPIASGRPKTRSGSKSRSTSTTRPTTRSGEMSPTSRSAPEGDPPWMVSAYKPDPRLPPDQQLLPTVAKRLQQEKWEQEGKFGNVYDKEFRPLNDEVAVKPPELKPPELERPKVAEERQDQWPLRVETMSPPPSRPGTSSYSTMPKIQDKPVISPLPSPRPFQQSHFQTTQAIRIPEPPEEQTQEKEKEKQAGCGCCMVM
jgi:hypothetical protein